MAGEERLIVGMDIGLRSLVTLSTGERYGGDLRELAEEAWREGGRKERLLRSKIRAGLAEVPWGRFGKIVVEKPWVDARGLAYVPGGGRGREGFWWPLGYVRELVREHARAHGIVLVWGSTKGLSYRCPKCLGDLYFYDRTREARCKSCGFRMDRDVYAALRVLLSYYQIDRWNIDEVLRGYFVSDEEAVEYWMRSNEAMGVRYSTPEDRERRKRYSLSFYEAHNRRGEVG